MRQGSIIPAAIAHAVWNILASVLSDSTDGWEVEVRGALVAIIAYVLFRFWPGQRGEGRPVWGTEVRYLCLKLAKPNGGDRERAERNKREILAHVAI